MAKTGSRRLARGPICPRVYKTAPAAATRGSAQCADSGWEASPAGTGAAPESCLFAGLAAQADRPHPHGSEGPAMIDFARARRMMVDCQLRPTEVTDHAVLGAMVEIPRERCVPAELASVAYLDRDLAVDAKRALLKPMVLARMIQALQVGRGERALDVACGTGYSSAILARLGAAATALEDDAERARRCGETLAQLGAGSVSTVSGPLDAGWAAGAPYNVILVNGACETEPQGLLRQLDEGGRLVAVIGTGPDTKATLFRMDRGEIGSRALFDATAPALPAFAKAPAFVF